MAVRAPERLTAAHRLDGFRCVHPSLTRWLRDRALASQATGASNTFVACDDAGDGKAVVGFYSLAAGAITHAQTPSARLRRNMPDPIPAALLARLAVHDDFGRRGIGSGLLKDAVLRCLRAAREGPGISALLCHAIDASAKDFYLKHGFVPSPIDDLTVMLGLEAFKR